MEVDVDAAIGVELASKKDIEAMMRDHTPYINKVFRPYSAVTDANGNLLSRIYDVEDGKIFSIGKAILWADGFTPAVPYVNAACWAGIFHGGQISAANLADFAPLSPGGQVFPSTFEYGLHQSPEFASPDNVTLGVFNGPPTTNVTLLLYGELRVKTIKPRSIGSIRTKAPGINKHRLPV
jgi:hypothetical protein